MWNIGDDAILYGVRRLLDGLLGPCNAIVYNRHPDLHHLRIRQQPLTVHTARGDQTIDLRPFASRLTWRYDNSWRDRDHNQELDMVVFAGTPEWMGSMVNPLVESLLNTELPVLYLGLGSFEALEKLTYSTLPQSDRRLLERALLVTTRDPFCTELLAPVGAHPLPCPSIFAAAMRDEAPPKARRQKKIALCTQGGPGESRQPVREQTARFCIAAFREIARKYDCVLVCHYVDELRSIGAQLGDVVTDVRYSYDARDYFDLYRDCELTVTTRVHGAGLCASLGIPSFVISHSCRSPTAIGFLSEFIDPATESISSVMTRIEGFDSPAAAARLWEHIERTRTKYHELLSSRLAACGLRTAPLGS